MLFLRSIDATFLSNCGAEKCKPHGTDGVDRVNAPQLCATRQTRRHRCLQTMRAVELQRVL